MPPPCTQFYSSRCKVPMPRHQPQNWLRHRQTVWSCARRFRSSLEHSPQAWQVHLPPAQPLFLHSKQWLVHTACGAHASYVGFYGHPGYSILSKALYFE